MPLQCADFLSGLVAPLVAHADAVKVGPRTFVAALFGVDRPHLDGDEHDGKPMACRMDTASARRR